MLFTSLNPHKGLITAAAVVEFIIIRHNRSTEITT